MALITIVDKSTLDTLTALEFNQILDALKDGTLEINTAGFRIAGAVLTPSAVQFNMLATNGAKGNALLGRDASGVLSNITSINGDPNITSPLAFLNMPFWVKKVVNHDDTSPVTILSIADGYVVYRVITKVTEAWDDGSKAFKIGHGSDDDAFITDLGAALGTPKYYGFDNTYWGARLYNSVDKHSKIWIADGSYDLKATFVGTGNGGSAGQCEVYILLSRLS